MFWSRKRCFYIRLESRLNSIKLFITESILKKQLNTEYGPYQLLTLKCTSKTNSWYPSYEFCYEHEYFYHFIQIHVNQIKFSKIKLLRDNINVVNELVRCSSKFILIFNLTVWLKQIYVFFIYSVQVKINLTDNQLTNFIVNSSYVIINNLIDVTISCLWFAFKI